MKVEFSERLSATLAKSREVLQIQDAQIAEKELEERYLNRPFGNAYNFDQEEPLAAATAMG